MNICAVLFTGPSVKQILCHGWRQREEIIIRNPPNNYCYGTNDIRKY